MLSAMFKKNVMLVLLIYITFYILVAYPSKKQIRRTGDLRTPVSGVSRMASYSN